MAFDELIVGTVCGGSDGTSGITANPAVGRASTGSSRKARPASSRKPASSSAANTSWPRAPSRRELGREIDACVDKAANYYRIMGHGSFAPGNAEGGLTTQEEKSMGAYSKSGSSPISGLIKPGDVPPRGGLYLLDVVPDGEARWGFPNITDIQEIGELIACGSHVTLFTTGRGSVVGSAISPVIKICANPDTYARMGEDMDINAGRILRGADSMTSAAKSSSWCRASRVASCRSPRRSATRNSSSPTNNSNRSARPACQPRKFRESRPETRTFWLRGAERPVSCSPTAALPTFPASSPILLVPRSSLRP